MNTGSLRLRLFLAAAISIALALTLTGLALVRLFESQVRARVITELNNDLQQLAAVIQIAPDGKVSVPRELADPRFNEPYGGRYWRIAPATPVAGQPILRSASLWDFDINEASPKGPEGEPLIVVSRELKVGKEGAEIPLHLIVAGHEEEIQRPLDTLRDQLILSMGLIGLVLLVGAWLQVKVGLKPLTLLQAKLAEVRTGRESRLSGSFPSEVSPLVTEINTLLDSQERSLEGARRRAGDLAHGLKTPLTVLSAVARDLRRSKQKGQAEEIEEQAETMRRHVERALTRARLATGKSHSVTPLKPALDKMTAAMQRMPRGDELSWQIKVDDAAAVPIEAGDLTELLGNLLDNARKWAAKDVRVTYADRLLVIEDDGPGVPEAELGRIAERGRRLDESRQGSGLGLSIVADIADTYGLTVGFLKSPLGGLRVEIRL